MSTGYHNLQVTPFDSLELHELYLSKMINEHTRMICTGIIPEEQKDEVVDRIERDTVIEVRQTDEEGVSRLLFSGLALSVEVSAQGGVYMLEVDAISSTYLLDRKRKSRSFQQAKLTIPELLRQIGQDYPGLDAMDEGTGGAKLGRFTLQYEETDWEFLRRLASRFRTSLVPAAQFDKPKFYFGIYEQETGIKLQPGTYTMRKRLAPYHYFTENDTISVHEHDFTVMELQTQEVLELGGSLVLQGRRFYVYEAHTSMQHGLLTHQYLLCPHKGLRKKRLYNERLIGASLPGTVIAVGADKVKVHLDIDEAQEASKAHWFPYTTAYGAGGNTGWYVMPEIGDRVAVYFPGKEEAEAVAGAAVRGNRQASASNKLGNPQVKLLRTPSGKEIRLGPDELVISGKEGEIYISLSEKEGISLTSSKQLSLRANGALTLKAKTISLSADKELQIDCKGSTLNMAGLTSLVGSEVKSN